MGRPSVKEAIEAIKANGGFVATAARKLGTSRTPRHAMINEHPTLKQALDDARELKKDHAEGRLFQAIEAGNITGIIFYLKTQAPERGYGRGEVTQTINLDMSSLNDEQLQRIANGEPPAAVLADSSDS